MGLGERLNGIQEVSGSIPLISTIKSTRVRDRKALKREFQGFSVAFCYEWVRVGKMGL